MEIVDSFRRKSRLMRVRIKHDFATGLLLGDGDWSSFQEAQSPSSNFQAV